MSKVAWAVVAGWGRLHSAASVASAATLAALPMGALLLFTALFLGMGRTGVLVGRDAIGGATDLLGHDAA